MSSKTLQHKNTTETRGKRYNYVCNDFMYARCKRTVCKFEHDLSVCSTFWITGQCTKNECTNRHVRKDFSKTQTVDPGQDLNNKNVPKKNVNKDKDNVNSNTSKKDHDINKNVPKKSRNKDKYNNRRKKNTCVFEPMTKPVDARIVVDVNSSKCGVDLSSRDILLVPNLFRDFKPNELYTLLQNEITTYKQTSDRDDVLKLWHGNENVAGTHLIMNDRTGWKQQCPTFTMVIERIRSFFDMDIKSTRLNWYQDTSHWKPFHFDASAVKPDKAAVQNFTVAVSFGATRSCAFERDDTNRTVISFPVGDGEMYCFAQDTNCMWRHGVLQETPVKNVGRISVICWGYINNILDVNTQSH